MKLIYGEGIHASGIRMDQYLNDLQKKTNWELRISSLRLYIQINLRLYTMKENHATSHEYHYLTRNFSHYKKY